MNKKIFEEQAGVIPVLSFPLPPPACLAVCNDEDERSSRSCYACVCDGVCAVWVQRVFQDLDEEARKPGVKMNIFMSFIQIYLTDVQDLLNPHEKGDAPKVPLS